MNKVDKSDQKKYMKPHVLIGHRLEVDHADESLGWFKCSCNCLAKSDTKIKNKKSWSAGFEPARAEPT